MGGEGGGIPSEVGVGPGDGVPKASVVNLDTITTIPKVDRRERIATLGPEKARAVDDAIRFALGLSP